LGHVYAGNSALLLPDRLFFFSPDSRSRPPPPTRSVPQQFLLPLHSRSMRDERFHSPVVPENPLFFPVQQNLLRLPRRIPYAKLPFLPCRNSFSPGNFFSFLPRVFLPEQGIIPYHGAFFLTLRVQNTPFLPSRTWHIPAWSPCRSIECTFKAKSLFSEIREGFLTVPLIANDPSLG